MWYVFVYNFGFNEEWHNYFCVLPMKLNYDFDMLW
jgi:hypothetical protein